MDIAFVSAEESRRTDEVLSTVAAQAMAEGIRLAGAVQPGGTDVPGEKCRIILNLLPEGPVRDISLDLGTGATACRLDAGALEEAAMVVMDRLPGAEALIVNKFGKQEAAGRGLVTAMGEAAERGVPILVGVSPEWLAAFDAFAGGDALRLPDDPVAVLAWLRAARARIAA